MAGKFSLVQTDDRNINQLQQNISQALEAILSNPLVNGNILNGVKLQIGSNTLNHGLNRNLQGWIPILVNAAADVFDEQATNTNPSKTLILNSSAVVTVSIYCF